MTTKGSDEEVTLEARRLEKLQQSLAVSPKLLWENLERLGELRYKLMLARESGDTKVIWAKAEEYRAQERRFNAVSDRIITIISELLKAAGA
jgi:hypothetical protein